MNDNLNELEQIAFQLKLIKVELQRMNDLAEEAVEYRKDGDKMAKNVLHSVLHLATGSKAKDLVEFIDEQVDEDNDEKNSSSEL